MCYYGNPSSNGHDPGYPDKRKEINGKETADQ